MLEGQRFSFTERRDSLGRFLVMPYIPLMLTLGDRSVDVMALLDTGASVNVLPFEIGLQLGAVWEEQTVTIPLSGNLASSEARLGCFCLSCFFFACVIGICLDSIK